MARERACEVKETFVLSSGFWSWCGKKWPESRPDDGKTPVCQDCVEAKAKADAAAAKRAEKGGLWAWLNS